jgi:hypothetical protein
MAQVFPRWTNNLALYLAAGKGMFVVVAVAGIWYWGSPKFTDVGYMPTQPVPYSHELHAGELGIDCRYCHASVDVSPVATVPGSQVCMNCHGVVGRDVESLAPIRETAAEGRSVRWIRIHNLPDYAYFSHAVHVNAGVGCVSCHGRIDRMETVQQVEPLSMSWCLECHRNPAPHLRPTDEVTNMEWRPTAEHASFAAETIRERGIAPPTTDCSGCHR